VIWIFKLEMTKTINLTYGKYASGYKTVFIHKIIELPFAPSVNLIISDKGLENKITTLYWHNDLQMFIAEFKTENDERLWAQDIEQALKTEFACGWEIND
jgi:hypothetical protein